MSDLADPRFLDERLAHWAETKPNDEAVTYLDRTWTWSQWNDRVRRLAGALTAFGVKRGDVVAFLDKNHPACLELTFAAASLGAANAIINFRLAADEMDYVLNDSGAKVLIVGAELKPGIDKIRDKLPNVEQIIEVTPEGGDGDEYEALLAGATPVDRSRDVDPDDVCIIMYSSGTTGRPKGVALTQANLIAHTVNGQEGFEFDDGDKNMVSMPLFHVGGTSYAQLGIHNGIPSVMTRDVDGAALAGAILQGREPHIPGARRAGEGTGFGPGRGEVVQRSEDVLVRRLADAVAALAVCPAGLAEHRLHPGVRADRAVRRHQPPHAGGPSLRPARSDCPARAHWYPTPRCGSSTPTPSKTSRRVNRANCGSAQSN